jgi:hypothetical protein
MSYNDIIYDKNLRNIVNQYMDCNLEEYVWLMEILKPYEDNYFLDKIFYMSSSDINQLVFEFRLNGLLETQVKEKDYDFIFMLEDNGKINIKREYYCCMR